MSDEIFYAIALEEYEAGKIDAGLKAKAYVVAEGDEQKVKVEYIKLRVKQLKGSQRKGSLHDWYKATSHPERATYVVISLLLIPLFGLGLIPLGLLIWLHAGEQGEMRRQAKDTCSETRT